MSSKKLKQRLIRLGNTNPSLRKHLRPVLDEITKTSSIDKVSSVARVTEKLVDYLNTGGDKGPDWYYEALDKTGADLYFSEELTADKDPTAASDVFVLTDGSEKYVVEYDERDGQWQEMGSSRRAASTFRRSSPRKVRREEMSKTERKMVDKFYDLHIGEGLPVDRAVKEAARDLEMSEWDLRDALKELGVTELT